MKFTARDFFLALAMGGAVFSGECESMVAADIHTVGEFRYEIMDNLGEDAKDAWLIGLADGYVPKGDICIPAVVAIDGMEIKVVGIGHDAGGNETASCPVFQDYPEITSVTIGENIRKIGYNEFFGCESIESYAVAEKNRWFSSTDGLLLETSSGYINLLRYPSARTDRGWTVHPYIAISGTGQKRDVVTEQFYVTREYEKDTKSGKKSNGVKYDYFQKQDSNLISFVDFEESENEVWQYGNSGLQTVTVVSTFNPNRYKTNGKYYDYKYKKSQINASTLRLKKDTKKNVSIYIYNENKMLADQINYGQEKEETLYTYDESGKGSLVVLETEKSFGKTGDKAVTTKQGYTYDGYRNVLTKLSPKAYLKKNSGKKHLYTTTYTYHGTGKGFPVEDAVFVCPVEAEESYTSANTISRIVSTVASNGIDYSSILEQRSVNSGAYKTISKTDFRYDTQGNEIQGKVYPSYSTDGEKEVIQNDYTYNSLGQQTKKIVTITSAKHPADNRTYTEEEVSYDSFGNELTYTDENGLVSKTFYDPESGEETETINAVGTEYESKDKEYQSADGLKTMTVDHYGRVSIEIQDAFGNMIISKDEAAGTWTESIYDYGSEGDADNTSDDDNDSDEGKEETAHLIEERTYTFEPDEKRFIVNENGETVPNFYITGKGKEILSGSKYFYDDLGNEIGSAECVNMVAPIAVTVHCAKGVL